jgi:putative copper export protein
MQAITFLGLALCLGVLFLRARKARKQPPRSLKQRFDTAHLLFGALLAWLVISMTLQHLNREISGEPRAPQSVWERVIETLSDWI